jgi:acetyl-CoA synthetase
VASEVAYGFEMAPGRTFCWITDMGWIMGPLSIFSAHACGGFPAALRRLPGRPGHR